MGRFEKWARGTLKRRKKGIEEKFTFKRSCGSYPCLVAGSDSYSLERNLRAEGLVKVSWELGLPKRAHRTQVEIDNGVIGCLLTFHIP